MEFGSVSARARIPFCIQSGLAWGARVLAASALCGAAFALARRGETAVAHALVVAAFGVSAVAAGLAFWRNRRAYLEAADARRSAPAPAPRSADAA